MNSGTLVETVDQTGPNRFWHLGHTDAMQAKYILANQVHSGGGKLDQAKCILAPASFFILQHNIAKKNNLTLCYDVLVHKAMH